MWLGSLDDMGFQLSSALLPSKLGARTLLLPYMERLGEVSSHRLASVMRDFLNGNKALGPEM